MIMVASLLKFYPFVLFILLLRERLRVLLLTGLTAFCLMAGLVVVFFNEVRRMFANIPVPSSFTDAFGAAQLPAGLGILAESLLRVGGITGSASGMLPIKVLVSVPITALVILASWAAGRYLAQRDDFRAAANALTRRELLTLVAGAVLVCGCFLSGRSIGYREIIIVLAMPGLSALARTSPAPWLRRLFLWTVWNAVFLMFYAVPQRLIYNTFGNLAQGLPSVPAIVLWFVREICWWWLIAVLVAVLVRFVADSPVWMGFARHPWLVQKNRSNQAKVSSGASSAM